MENPKRDRYCHPFGGKKAATTTTWAHTTPRLRLLTALLLAAFAAAPVAAQDGSFQLGTVVVTGAAQGAEIELHQYPCSGDAAQ